MFVSALQHNPRLQGWQVFFAPWSVNNHYVYKAYSYRSVINILEKGLDKGESLSLAPSSALAVTRNHENIRGADYYAENAPKTEIGGVR